MTTDSSPLTPLGQRTSDEVITTDLARIAAWRERLASLPADRDPYRHASARAWLDAAETEYTDNDETGFAEAALERAAGAVEAMASGAPPVAAGTLEGPRPPTGSSRVSPELWDRLDRMQHDPGFACAAEELARLEVELALAGNEALDQGDCTTSPHADEAKRLADEAARELAACRPPAPGVTPVVPPAPPPPPAIPTPEPDLPVKTLEVPRNVHFAYDRCELTPESRAVIERVAREMRLYPAMRIRLEGHTDSRGTSAYNLGLSRCRLCAVLGEFERQGILSSRIDTESRGKSQLLTTERSRLGHARNRRVEMVLIGPDGTEIPTRSQDQDLQLEPLRRTRGPARPGAAEFPEYRETVCPR